MESIEVQHNPDCDSTSPSLLQDITLEKSDMVMRNSSAGLTMKEYEEQLKKLTAENFNLKLRIYFVEERLSKVKGISDKEELVKKIIELQVACEAKSKELESKQELIYEASKALDTLQLEHEEQLKKLKKEKEKEIEDLTSKVEALEQALKEAAERFAHQPQANSADYEKQIQCLEDKLTIETEKVKDLQDLLRETHADLEAYQVKFETLENESEQRLQRVEELMDELQAKEQELKNASFQLRKFDEELSSRQREEEILKERLEEKSKTIDSLKASLTARDTTVTLLEAKCAKEKSGMQSIQAKFDSMNFQNNRLKAEIEVLHSRLKRSNDTPSRNKKSGDEDMYKQKYEDFVRAVEEREEEYSKKLTEMKEKCMEKEAEVNECRQLLAKNKKLEDDHKKACAALRNFIKRSTEEKKERENLRAALKLKEEELQMLRLQMGKDLNLQKSQEILSGDNKLSLADTGDNGKCAEPDLKCQCQEKDKQIEMIMENLERKDSVIEEYKEKMLACKCGVEEKIERIQELEAEIFVLKCQMEDKPNEEQLHSELACKKTEIEKLNNELSRRNHNLQELVNKELWDKNRQIEKLEKRLNSMTEKNDLELKTLNQQIVIRDQQLRVLQDQFADLGITLNMSLSLASESEARVKSEIGNLSEDFNSTNNVMKLKAILVENLNEKKYLKRKVDELNEKLRNAPERDCGSKSVHNLTLECAKEKEDIGKAEVFRREAADMCALLILRLEELAGFLDSLLTNQELLTGLGSKRRQDIIYAVEKSRELSKHLTLSLIGNNKGTLLIHPDDDSFADLLTTNISNINESLGVSINRDKVVAEQSAIIMRLRDQLKMLNEEIKQRDIEISKCQAEHATECSDSDVCPNLVNASTQFSDPLDDNQQRPETNEQTRIEKSVPKTILLAKKCKNSHIQDASESEAWSEPDRSVSQARMGHIEDSLLSLSIRGSKLDDSTEDSSEETMNEKSRTSVKYSRGSESEIRRLQARIRIVEEANEELRKELEMLKNSQGDVPLLTKFHPIEEANLSEKLTLTLEQLEKSKITCRDFECKLSEALERASASAVQLSKANETITFLEEEVRRLKEELESKALESNQKSEMIEDFKSKLEEKILESELRLLEANKRKEEAERKTLEVECRLKEAENMSKEVESRVVEIEKKINETKRFKKETVMQFKEAERNVDTAEKIMEEAEKMRQDAERKSKDFQNYVDLMRKDVEERVKEAERRVKRAEKEKEEMEKHLSKLKKRLLEAEENKSEVEMKVKEGKETIQCMEEKLKELEIAMEQCNKEAQRRIKEIQKKADAKVLELEHQIQEREWLRKNEAEKKMLEAEKISWELEIGFKKQLEDAEKRVKESKDLADLTVKKIEDEFKKQELDLKQKVIDIENEKDAKCAEYQRQLDEIRVEASELELELTKVTNEKIQLEEEIKRMLDKESALMKDNREIRGRYEKSVYELETKLAKLALNKSELASRLEEIESTNFDLASRISAIRGKDVERDFDGLSPPPSPVLPQSLLTNLLTEVDFQEINGNCQFVRQLSGGCDSNEQLVLGVQSIEAFAPPRRNMNSSPDLGIESDPGRFSSLEAQHQLNMDPILITGKREESEVKRLENENAELRRRLVKTRQALEETLTQLSAANQRKKQVERAICRQLHKTHHVLKRARGNLERQDSE